MISSTIDIHGLNCPNCALKLERAIAALHGVRNAQIELETETVTVEYDPEGVSLDQIVSRITAVRCESDCFDMTDIDRSLGTAERELDIEWTPTEHGRGCCQVSVDEGW